jgi:dsDNA-specific endonuclease/ATPase MutS2
MAGNDYYGSLDHAFAEAHHARVTGFAVGKQNGRSQGYNEGWNDATDAAQAKLQEWWNAGWNEAVAKANDELTKSQETNRRLQNEIQELREEMQAQQQKSFQNAENWKKAYDELKSYEDNQSALVVAMANALGHLYQQSPAMSTLVSQSLTREYQELVGLRIKKGILTQPPHRNTKFVARMAGVMEEIGTLTKGAVAPLATAIPSA